MCSYCGGEVRTATYQSRAADEAPRTVTGCTGCLLDPYKVSEVLQDPAPDRSVTTGRVPGEEYAGLDLLVATPVVDKH